MTLAAEKIVAKIEAATGERVVETGGNSAESALEAGIITLAESETLRAVEEAVRAAVDVDDFAASELSPAPAADCEDFVSVA
jgi:hypothetical protein